MIDATAPVEPSEASDLPDLLEGVRQADDDRDASAAIGALIMEIAMRDRAEARRSNRVEKDSPESTPPSLTSG